MKLLIVDDEPPARERLRRLLAEIGDFEVVGEAGNGEQALEPLRRAAPDIVLLDVRMPGIDGLEVARHLATLEDPPAVIFTTAFDEYALEAFESEAVGYLLKPVRKEKLAHALAKAARISRAGCSRWRRRRASSIGATRSARGSASSCASFRSRRSSIFTPTRSTSRSSTASGESLIEDSLKTLAEEFAPDFVRIHRNALIAEKQISRWSAPTQANTWCACASAATCWKSAAVMRRSCCGGFAAKPEQLPRGRIPHQSLRRPAQQAARPDQRDDGDRAADHRRMRSTRRTAARPRSSRPSSCSISSALVAELLPLHGAARQQVAVMGGELIEALVDSHARLQVVAIFRELRERVVEQRRLVAQLLRNTSPAKIAMPTNMPIIASEAAMRCVSQNAKMTTSAARNKPSIAVNAAMNAHSRIAPTCRTSSCSSVVSSCRRVCATAISVPAKLLSD